MPGDRRRQQWPRRLGIHQQLRRFPGPRPARAGTGRRGQLPDGRRPARVRARDGDARSRGRRARGARRSQETIWGPVIGDDGDGSRARARAGPRIGPGATDMALLRLERARRSRRGRGDHRRRRHARTERDDRGLSAAASAGCSRAGCRGARASIASRPSSWSATGRGLERLDSAGGIAAPARPAAGLCLERERAGRRRRGLCA